jgi:hypothetical protein
MADNQLTARSIFVGAEFNGDSSPLNRAGSVSMFQISPFVLRRVTPKIPIRLGTRLRIAQEATPERASA